MSLPCEICGQPLRTHSIMRPCLPHRHDWETLPARMFRCYGCKQDKRRSEFPSGNRSPHQPVAHRCHECNRAHVRAYKLKQREMRVT